MTSALKTKIARPALFVALGLLAAGTVSASAADLGGNCCADLEERIAELEATTARKGNRKVSLTVSGWVNEAVFFWDDGVESNQYVGTNSLEQSRVRFTGDAKIAPGWTAGYSLELGVNGNASNQFSQASDGPSGSVTVRRSHWFIKNDQLGKLTVGLEGEATYHLLDSADGANTQLYADAEGAGVVMANFLIRVNGIFAPGNIAWKDVLRGTNNLTVGQGGRRNVVRYDTPVFQGFSATASWGEDDIWGGSLTYKGDIGDFKVIAKAGYSNDSDEGIQRCNTRANIFQDCEWRGVAGTIMHAPTGLYAYAGYGQQKDNARAINFPAIAAAQIDDTDTMWFVQGGIEQKFHALGKTTIFGEFRNDDGGSNPGKNLGGTFIKSSSVDFWAAGIVQNIDAAAMDIYVIYRHAEGDVVNGRNVTTTLDDFDMVMTGARITF